MTRAEEIQEALSEVMEWFDNRGFINGVHYDEESIMSRIKEVLYLIKEKEHGPSKTQERTRVYE